MMVSLTAGLNMEGIVKWRGLKSQGPLYCIIHTYCSLAKIECAIHVHTNQSDSESLRRQLLQKNGISSSSARAASSLLLSSVHL